MPKSVGSFERGKADILSISAIGFLILSLVAIVSVTSNPQIKQIFAPKALNTEYDLIPITPPSLPTSQPVTSGFTIDQIINTTNHTPNTVGYDCRQGGCGSNPAVISGYYESNGRYYAIGGTGNDPNRYASTSLAAVKANGGTVPASQTTQTQTQTTTSGFTKDQVINTKAAANTAGYLMSNGTISGYYESNGRYYAIGGTNNNPTVYQNTSLATIKAEAAATAAKANSIAVAEKRAADSLARIDAAEKAATELKAKQSVITVNPQGGVSIKVPNGGTAKYSSDCESGNSEGGICQAAKITTPLPANYNQILNGVPTPIIGAQLTESQIADLINAAFPKLPTNLTTPKQETLQTPTLISTNTNDTFPNSLVSENPFSNLTKSVAEKSESNQTNLTIKDTNSMYSSINTYTVNIGGSPDVSITTPLNYKGTVANLATNNVTSFSQGNQTSSTILAPTSMNFSSVVGPIETAQTSSFNLSDWTSNTWDNVTSFFQKKPVVSTTSPSSTIPEVSEIVSKSAVDQFAENKVTAPITNPVQQQTQSTPKVIILGDSITQGYLSSSLLEQLKAKGYDIDFLGNQKSINGISTEGHGGYTTVAIKNSLEAGKWYYQLDKKSIPLVQFDKNTSLIVLELGVNDMGSGFNPDLVTIPNMKYIVDYLRKNVNPNIKVVIAPVPNIYFQNKDHFKEAKYLNSKLAEMTSQISTPDSPIVMGESITDQYILSQNTQPDGVHPNKAGADKIAESIVNTIENNQLITKQEEISFNTPKEDNTLTVAQTYYSQTSPEWQDYKITVNEKDAQGNITQATRTMKQVGCGPTTVANILNEGGKKVTPTQIAKQIPSAYWASGGTSFQTNIEILKQNGYKADPYTKSLYNLTKYMKPDELLWISAKIEGIEHHTYIDGYTMENGKPVFSMRDPYFGTDMKCSVASGGTFGCNGSSGQHTYNVENEAVIILTPPAI